MRSQKQAKHFRALFCTCAALAVVGTARAGTITREVWTNIGGGTAVSDLTGSANFPDSPDISEEIASFEAPADWADNYGTRILGYVIPPASGDYTFWIAGDDNCDLYLSSDADPVNATRIAAVTSWTSSREWTKEPAQQSGAITLSAGQKYYIEALQKEGGGGDNLAVAWQGPTLFQQVIDGAYLEALGAMGYVNGLEYEYYEDALGSVLDFDLPAILPVTLGTCANFDITNRVVNDNFGFRFRGFIRILDAGDYTFYTNSDDGSMLWIDGALVVNNDGAHGPLEVAGTVNLAPGMHDILVGFYENGGGEELDVSYEGPGVGKQLIPDIVLYRADGGSNSPPTVDAGNDALVVMTAALTLSASASDIDGDSLSYAWTVDSGPSVPAFDAAALNPTVTFGVAGDYVLRLSVSDSVNPPVEDTVTIRSFDPAYLSLYVNCGDNAYDVSSYIRDDDYVTGGYDWVNPGEVDAGGISVTGPQGCYKSMRRGSPHSYNFPGTLVPNGTYTVRIYFADDDAGAARAMDYFIEGVQVVDDLDVVDVVERANAALVLAFKVDVTDGNGLQIDCIGDSGSDVFEAGLDISVGYYNHSAEVVIVDDQITIDWPVDTVSLNAAAWDPDGSVAYMEWTNLSTSVGTVTFADANAEDTTATFSNPGVYVLMLMADDSEGAGTADSVQVTVRDVPAGLPSPWQHADIGGVGVAGDATYADPIFTIDGGGADIWEGSDEFHYVYQPFPDAGEIYCRVISQQNTDGWAKAGVMIRDTLDASSAHAMMVVTPANGTSLQYRTAAGAGSGYVAGPGAVAPYSVRMVRVGDVFTGYASVDGNSWTQVGSVAITMGANVYVGLCVTSHNDGVVSRSTFDHVHVENGPPPLPLPPAADAGPDQTVTDSDDSGAEDVTLDGSASSDPDGTIVSYVWREGGSEIATGATAAVTLAIGTHTIELIVTDNDGIPTSDFVTVTVNPASTTTGTIVREYWTGIGGNEVALIPVGTAPSGTDTLTSFEGPTDWDEAYGSRIRGFVHPPATGEYTFWIASDDNSELWLSTSALDADKVRIASVGSWTGSRQWTTYPSQESVSIVLAAGQKYYIEALQKEGNGGDNLAVAWQGPAPVDTRDVIAGQYLSPYVATGPQAPIANAGADFSVTDSDGDGVEIVTLDGSGSYDPDGTVVSYVWTEGPGVLVASATTPTVTAVLSVGVHTIQLEVDDNDLFHGTDIVVITVLPASGLRVPENPANTVNGLEYEYYHDDGATKWSVLPDFDALTAEATGTVDNFDIGVRTRDDNFGFRFTGYIDVPADGTYTFITSSDDGSKLYIGSTEVVNNDGLHGTQSVAGTIDLAAGKHAITVTMFEVGGGEVLDVRYSGPGIAEMAVPAGVLYRVSGQTNVAPTVDAGADQAIGSSVGTCALSGTIADDGLPNPPGALSVAWTGPVSVIFTDAAAVDTTAIFMAVGSFDLTLTVSDGELFASDTVTITVNDDEAPTIPQNVQYGVESTTLVDVWWDASFDEVGVTGYRVFRNNVAVAMQSGTGFSDTGVSVGTHVYEIVAFDAAGNESARSAPVTVVVSAPNQVPVADFVSTPSSGQAPLAVTFDASGSSDPDGDTLTYGWDFGDSATGTGVTVSHTYATPGTYTVTLTVDDGNGGSDVATDTIVVSATNQDPIAQFVATPTSGEAPLDVSFDATASNDPDGDSLTYDWDFGDAGTGTGATPSHTYGIAGTYVVTLTLDDGNGGGDTATATIVVSVPNQNPVAVFSATPNAGAVPLDVAFDAAASSDPDGDSLDYVWDFGDSSTGVGVIQSHTYVSVGTYTVTLTVDDGNGGSDTAMSTVVVNATNTPPTVPQNVLAEGIAKDRVRVSWTASSDDVGVSEYRVYYDGSTVLIGISASTSFDDVGVTPGTYSYRVAAFDGVFESALSAMASATVSGADFVVTSTALMNVNAGYAAWGDYDNDGDLDLALGGYQVGPGATTVIYQNDGAGGLTEAGAGLEGMTNGTVAWCDYDGDAYLDLLVMGNDNARLYHNLGEGSFEIAEIGLQPGTTSSAAWGDFDLDGDSDLVVEQYETVALRTFTMYRNDSGGVFTKLSLPLEGMWDGRLACGDYDNDGALDIAVAGAPSSGGRALVIYHNNGDGTFAMVSDSLLGTSACAIAWVDYDNDGRLDLFVSGETGATPVEGVTRLYHNEGGNAFVSVGVSIPGLVQATCAWGDYDNDGDADLLLAGLIVGDSQVRHTDIYRNDGGGTFTPIAAGLVDVYQPILAWGDYDGDGDLDALVAGHSSTGRVTKLYRNNGGVFNSLPAAPAGLQVDKRPTMGAVALSWDDASDTETPALGLSYNVRLVDTDTGLEVRSSLSNPLTGVSKVQVAGAIRPSPFGAANEQTLTLPDGNYSWSVQTIDSGLAASPWSTPYAFVPGDDQGPTVPQNLVGVPVSPSQVDLSWDRSSDDSGVEGYDIYRDGSLLNTTAGRTYSDTGLAYGTYDYLVVAFDPFGNESSDSNVVSVSLTAPVLASVTITPEFADVNLGDTQQFTGECFDQYGDPMAASISWSLVGEGNLDTSGLYTALATSGGPYTVTATAGSYAAAAEVTIDDFEAPTVPSISGASAASSSQIDLSWSASSDNVGVAGYVVFVSGAQVETTDQLTYSATGLDFGTEYSCSVVAVDAMGNASDPSVAVLVTTPDLMATLTVSQGSGSGAYMPGDAVTIVADRGIAGQVFSAWTGDTQFVTGTAAACTTVIMPAQDVSLAAQYADANLTKLISSDFAAGDLFGSSVASQGDVAVIGAQGDDDNGTQSGSAYVFLKGVGGWQQDAKLTAPDGISADYFGTDVAISGNRIVVGAPGALGAATRTGAAYVFEYAAGSGWDVGSKLPVPKLAAVGDVFGYRVAIDGDIVAVSSMYRDRTVTDCGAVSVYRWTGSSWLHDEDLLAPYSYANDNFGMDVAILGDVILCVANSGGHLYRNISATSDVNYNPEASMGTLAWGAALGVDVAILGRRGTPGAAHVLEHSGLGWAEVAALTPSDLSGDLGYTYSVALEGDNLLAGAYDVDGTGAAFLFRQTTAGWYETAKLIPDDGASGDKFGQAVSITGNTALIGAPHHDGFATIAGVVYVVTLPESAPGDVALISPADEATLLLGEVTFDWDDAVGATSYRLVVSDNQYMLTPVIDDTVSATSSHTCDGTAFSVGGLYYWRVIAQNGAASVASDIFEFGVVDTIELLLPAAGASSVAIMPPFSWGRSAEADTYTLVISEVLGTNTYTYDQIANPLDGDEVSLLFDSLTTDTLAANTEYEWQVLALDSAGLAIASSSATSLFLTAPSATSTDYDGDGIPNSEETETNMYCADSDWDGVDDGDDLLPTREGPDIYLHKPVDESVRKNSSVEFAGRIDPVIDYSGWYVYFTGTGLADVQATTIDSAGRFSKVIIWPYDGSDDGQKTVTPQLRDPAGKAADGDPVTFWLDTREPTAATAQQAAGTSPMFSPRWAEGTIADAQTGPAEVKACGSGNPKLRSIVSRFTANEWSGPVDVRFSSAVRTMVVDNPLALQTKIDVDVVDVAGNDAQFQEVGNIEWDVIMLGPTHERRIAIQAGDTLLIAVTTAGARWLDNGGVVDEDGKGINIVGSCAQASSATNSPTQYDIHSYAKFMTQPPYVYHDYDALQIEYGSPLNPCYPGSDRVLRFDLYLDSNGSRGTAIALDTPLEHEDVYALVDIYELDLRVERSPNTGSFLGENTGAVTNNEEVPGAVLGVDCDDDDENGVSDCNQSLSGISGAYLVEIKKDLLEVRVMKPDRGSAAVSGDMHLTLYDPGFKAGFPFARASLWELKDDGSLESYVGASFDASGVPAEGKVFYLQGEAVGKTKRTVALMVDYLPEHPETYSFRHMCRDIAWVTVIATSQITSTAPEETILTTPRKEVMFKGGERPESACVPARGVYPGPGLAQTIFFDEATSHGEHISDFSIWFVPQIIPGDLLYARFAATAGYVLSADPLLANLNNQQKWERIGGPNTASMSSAEGWGMSLSNPHEGGLYRFAYNVAGHETAVQAHLPAAGAEIMQFLLYEMPRAVPWARRHETNVWAANYSDWPGVTEYNVFRTWCMISGAFFDYAICPIDADETVPCRAYNDLGGMRQNDEHYGYVTMGGVVVHGSKVNNMMWGLFGRAWGYTKLELLAGAHGNQAFRTWSMDGPASQRAIGTGSDICDLYDAGQGSQVEELLQDRLDFRQPDDGLIEHKLWPCLRPYDETRSTMQRPWVPLTP